MLHSHREPAKVKLNGISSCVLCVILAGVAGPSNDDQEALRPSQLVTVALQRIWDRAGDTVAVTSNSTSTPVSASELLTLVAMQSSDVISAVLQRIALCHSVSGAGATRSTGHDLASVEVDVRELGRVIVEQPPAYQHKLLLAVFQVTSNVPSHSTAGGTANECPGPQLQLFPGMVVLHALDAVATHRSLSVQCRTRAVKLLAAIYQYGASESAPGLQVAHRIQVDATSESEGVPVPDFSQNASPGTRVLVPALSSLSQHHVRVTCRTSS